MKLAFSESSVRKVSDHGPRWVLDRGRPGHDAAPAAVLEVDGGFGEVELARLAVVVDDDGGIPDADLAQLRRCIAAFPGAGGSVGERAGEVDAVEGGGVGRRLAFSPASSSRPPSRAALPRQAGRPAPVPPARPPASEPDRRWRASDPWPRCSGTTPWARSKGRSRAPPQEKQSTVAELDGGERRRRDEVAVPLAYPQVDELDLETAALGQGEDGVVDPARCNRRARH